MMLMALNVRLPNLAEHYEERLEGYRRYEDIPPGTKLAKRWSEFMVGIKVRYAAWTDQ